MPTLLSILRKKGISDAGNGTGDVKRIVAESVDELLNSEPVVTSAQIGLVLLQDRLLNEVLIAFVPDYTNPSNNPYFAKIPNLKYLRLNEAVKRTLRKKPSSFRLTFGPRGGRRMHYNTVLFYHDMDKLRSYIRDRLQARTDSYVFRS